MEIIRLKSENLEEFRGLMKLFATAFNERDTYLAHPPSNSYFSRHLSKDHIIHLVAKEGSEVVGGLVAYVLEKFEQERSEVYIYDLAVAEGHRRKGIATRLIHRLKEVAHDYDAWVQFVQADYEDPPAIRLYESLGQREEVLHFDIGVSP